MFGLGIGEILIILVIALVFIGPKKLPELARGLGKGIREFNKARNELMDEVNRTEEVDKVSLKSDENKSEAVDEQLKKDQTNVDLAQSNTGDDGKQST